MWRSLGCRSQHLMAMMGGVGSGPTPTPTPTPAPSKAPSQPAADKQAEAAKGHYGGAYKEVVLPAKGPEAPQEQVQISSKKASDAEAEATRFFAKVVLDHVREGKKPDDIALDICSKTADLYDRFVLYEQAIDDEVENRATATFQSEAKFAPSDFALPNVREMRVAIAANTINQSQLAELAKDPDRETRRSVARNDYTLGPQLRELAKAANEDATRDVAQLTNIAKHPNTPADLREQLAKDAHPMVRRAAERVIAQEKFGALVSQAEKSSPGGAIRFLENHLNKGGDINVLSNVDKLSLAQTSRDPDTLARIANGNPDPSISSMLAQNVATPGPALEKIAEDNEDEPDVLACVARHAKAPDALRQQLAQNEDPRIQNAALHPLRAEEGPALVFDAGSTPPSAALASAAQPVQASAAAAKQPDPMYAATNVPVSSPPVAKDAPTPSKAEDPTYATTNVPISSPPPVAAPLQKDAPVAAAPPPSSPPDSEEEQLFLELQASADEQS